MSNIFSASEMGEAQSVAIGSLRQSGTGGAFHARFADGQEITKPIPAAMRPSAKTDALEQAKADAFAQGFDEGMRAASEAFAADEAAIAQLASALEQVAPAANGMLSSLLSSAVTRLVTQIVGEAPVNADLLAQRVQRVAAFIEEGQAGNRLHVNPADLPLLEGHEIGYQLTPDESVSRGCVRLDTADGWVEDGPDIQLSRLKAMLDDMEGQG